MDIAPRGKGDHLIQYWIYELVSRPNISPKLAPNQKLQGQGKIVKQIMTCINARPDILFTAEGISRVQVVPCQRRSWVSVQRPSKTAQPMP